MEDVVKWLTTPEQEMVSFGNTIDTLRVLTIDDGIRLLNYCLHILYR